MGRGRIIWTHLADIYTLDSAETNKDPDLAGPLTSGYDDVFMEPVRVQESAGEFGAPRGVSARKEKKQAKVPVQIKDDNMEVLQQMVSGPTPGARLTTYIHYRTLEDLGLLDSDKVPSIFRNCRLDSIYHARSGELLHRFTTERALYAQEIRPVGWGLSGGRINLLMIRFEDREQSDRG